MYGNRYDDLVTRHVLATGTNDGEASGTTDFSRTERGTIMEAFGRTIALAVSIIGVVFLLFFSKTISVRWQKHETVRSLSRAFAEKLLWEKKISFNEWIAFQEEVKRFGGYRAEVVVYEGRRFENESGAFYLYQRQEITENRELREGSYVRVFVSQEEEVGRQTFLLGDFGAIVIGGRVR